MFQTASPVKSVFQTASPVKKIISNSVSPLSSPTKNVGSHTRLIQQKLMESTGSNWQEKQTAKAAEERKQEISSLVNHWEKLSSSSSADSNNELVYSFIFFRQIVKFYEKNNYDKEKLNYLSLFAFSFFYL